MLLETLRLLLVLALLVVLPGWLLTKALFPRPGTLRPAERAYLSVAGGVVVLVLIGVVLGFLPHGDDGHLQTVATGGMPNAELATLAVSALLFWIGLNRGAFPRVAARYPRLKRAAVSPGIASDLRR